MNNAESNPFEGLKELIKSKVVGVSFRQLNADLIIQGSPSDYQDVRKILEKKRVDVLLVRDPMTKIIQEIRISSIDIKGKEFAFRKPKPITERVERKGVVVKPKSEEVIKIKKEKVPKLKKEKPIKLAKPKKIVMVKKTIVSKKKAYKKRKPSLVYKKAELLNPSKVERYKDSESLEMQVLWKAPLKLLCVAIFSKPFNLRTFLTEYKNSVGKVRTVMTLPRHSAKFCQKEVMTVMKAPAYRLAEVMLARPESQIKVLLGKYNKMKLKR